MCELESTTYNLQHNFETLCSTKDYHVGQVLSAVLSKDWSKTSN